MAMRRYGNVRLLKISLMTHPQGAAVRLSRGDSVEFEGPSPVTAQVPSGDYTLTIELPGYNTFSREVSIDTSSTLEYYLDPEGQVLHGLGLITTLGAPKGVSVTHANATLAGLHVGFGGEQDFGVRRGDQMPIQPRVR